MHGRFARDRHGVGETLAPFQDQRVQEEQLRVRAQLRRKALDRPQRLVVALLVQQDTDAANALAPFVRSGGWHAGRSSEEKTAP